MPPRPIVKPKQSRPLSAVYIGKGTTSSSPSTHSSSPLLPSSSFGHSPTLPDLPEPPSPSSSLGSVESGLPSPPATNSTGSGSTGDPATIALRDRPLSLHSNSSTSTSSGSYAASTPVERSSNAPRSRSNSRSGEHSMDDAGIDADFDDDYDKNEMDDANLDGEDTARLNRQPLGSSSSDLNKAKGSSENQAALLRARNLSQRNRLALDKLSRLGSPSPARLGTPNSRSPAASHAGSSRSHSTRQSRALPQTPKSDPIRSGSETERESEHHSYTTSTHSRLSHSSSSHLPLNSSLQRSVSHSVAPSLRSTTPPNVEPRTSPQTSPYNRLRHISAPASPHKARLIAASSSTDSNKSSSPSSRRRNRASMASVQLTDFEEEDIGDDQGPKSAAGTARDRRRDRTLSEHDMITQSALAAVASSRRSPVGNKRRSALPREFRSDLADSSPLNGEQSGRMSSASLRRDSPDEQRSSPETGRRETWREPVTPFRSMTGRSATVREHRTGPNPRWSSDDFRTPITTRQREVNTSLSNGDGNPREHRQSLRGGSAESALALYSPGGRTLLGEGLRAAGLTRKREETGRRVSGPNGSADIFKERPRKVDWSPEDTIDDGRRRALVDRERERAGPSQRASTSMAHYQYRDRDSPEAPREHVLRGHRSTFSLATRDRERERDAYTNSTDRSTSALGRYSANGVNPPTPRLNLAHLSDRLSTASPFGSTRRYSAQPPPTPQTDHGKLMVDSLTMFETALSKVPRSQSSVGPISGSTHTELLQNAQGMVFAADRLCGMLKHGSTRALDAQVEAEVEAASRDPHPKEIVDIWSGISADYREGSRTADELVRGITGLLLGMGKVMREALAERCGASEFGSPALHGRHVSLGDEEYVRRVSPDIGLRRNGSGHGSAQASRSGAGSHPDSSSGRQSVASRHSWDLSRDKERDREDALRRLAGEPSRPESVLARASPSTFQRLKDHDTFAQRQQTYETPPPVGSRSSAPGSNSGHASTRRLFTPRDRREELPAEEGSKATHIRSATLATMDSQETVQPSPTPASRQLRGSPAVERPRPLPPIKVPQPLPTLPSERRSLDKSVENSTSSRDRRRATIRGNERPSFPSITSPANPTIALTPATISNGTDRSPFPRTESGRNVAKVTFSRPTAVSVSKSLSDQLQQSDNERRRTISTISVEAEADPTSAGVRDYVASPVSGSESETSRRKTLASRSMRMSLDSQRDEERMASKPSAAHAADRSAASTILPTTGKRERRRTVTDIWPR